MQTSADLSQRLTRLPDLQFGAVGPRGAPVIHVDDRVSYQRVTGFGGAMTDTSAWLLRRELSPAVSLAVMNDLFGARGISLDFLRLPIGASDFTKNGRPYSYDDLPPGQKDPRMSRFSIAHDKAYIIPALHQMLAINPHVEILANPWSPPGWMKANESLNNRQHTGALLPAAYAPLARYFVKFIQDFSRQGIPITAITPQNEPGNPTAYPGLELAAPSEASFATRYLRPALRAARLHTRIYGGDVALSGIEYVKELVSGAPASALDGIAWHCYFGSPNAISGVHRMAPRLDQIGDECSPGISPLPMPEVLISQLRNWASVVAFWNLALDPHHGPVQPPNHGCPSCTGLVTVDEHTGAVSFGPAYFQIGQASAFVQPGARRIRSEHFVFYDYLPPVRTITDGLDDVAFKNPDGSKVVVAYDNSSSPIRFGVQWQGRSFTYTLAPKAMVTFVWDRPGGSH